MTKHIVCAVKDSAAQTFGRFFQVPHANSAIRSFSHEVNRTPEPGSQNDLFSHPDDYELYQVGTFDDVSGLNEPMFGADDNGQTKLLPPQLLIRAKDITQRTDIRPTPRLELNGGSGTKKSVVMQS